MTEFTENDYMYLNSESKREDVLDPLTPEQRYIILMNDSLNYKNRELEINVYDLESQLEVFEDDINRLEKGKSYMENLLHNFIKINDWYKIITEKQNNIIYNIEYKISNFKRKAHKHLKYLQTGMILFLAFWYEYHKFIDFFPLLSIFIVISAFQESTLWNLNLPEHIEDKNTISNLMEEINKANPSEEDYIKILVITFLLY